MPVASSEAASVVFSSGPERICLSGTTSGFFASRKTCGSSTCERTYRISTAGRIPRHMSTRHAVPSANSSNAIRYATTASAQPVAHALWITPSARPRDSGRTSSATNTAPTPHSAPNPIPWKTRKVISIA